MPCSGLRILRKPRVSDWHRLCLAAAVRHYSTSERLVRADLQRAKRLMLQRHLRDRGIDDERVLQAFAQVPREQFLPLELRSAAYEDRALPIGNGQTISQPYVVARMLQALKLTGTEIALEVGTGSGYVAALLDHLARRVYTVERITSLALAAQERLSRLGYGATVMIGDGSLGWPARAPYDAIAVAASGPVIPAALTDQLALGGRMVLPVRRDKADELISLRRDDVGGLRSEVLEMVRFVPLIGAQGLSEHDLS